MNRFLRLYFALIVGYKAIRQYLKIHSEKSTLQPLTPALLEGKDIEKYEIELLGALNNKEQPKTRNIAITGAYGAGKSSFLHSFAERNPAPKYRYKFISLARLESLHESNNDDNQNEEGKKSIQEIEESIVQQLLYSSSHSELPETRFQRIRHFKLSSVLLHSTLFILFFLSIVSLSSEKYAKLFTESASFSFIKKLLSEEFPSSIDILPFLAEGIVASYLSYIVFLVTKAVIRFDFRGWTVKEGKLDIIRNDSVLNKHIDEIIYFFEKTKANIVIIEDLDRFKQTQVFEALREINIHVNNSKQITKPVYFLYAIKDSIFDAKDRTKFFDLIIPIVPVVNTSNSAPKLIEQLGKVIIDGISSDTLLDQHLVEKVADYIDDMRLIRNIVNEFNIYSNRISSQIGLDRNKLFGMIVIKNLYPKEHADLICNKGNFYEFLNGFDAIKEKAIEQHQVLKTELDSRLNAILMSTFECEEELRASLWLKIVEDLRYRDISASSHPKTKPA